MRQRDQMDRGPYRSCYTAMADDADIHAMCGNAFKLLWILKLTLPTAGIGVVYPATLAEQVGVSVKKLEQLLAELELPKPGPRPGWIRRDQNVVWIVNALACEPGMKSSSPNHRKSVRGSLNRLSASSPVVVAFREYYNAWFEDEPGSVSEEFRKGSGRVPEEFRKGSGSVSEEFRKGSGRVSEQEAEQTREQKSESANENEPKNEKEKADPSASANLERRVREELTTDADRLALTDVVHAAPAPFTWLSEMEAALDARAGQARLTPKQLGEALRDFVGNGDLKQPSFSRFRGYLRNASNPPPTAAGHRSKRARAGDAAARPRSKPTESIKEVRWQS